MAKKVIALDFDGVLHSYRQWKGEGLENMDGPVRGARQFLEMMKVKGWVVVIYSTRKRRDIELWLKKWEMDMLVDEISETKPMALLYVDDRGMRFDGDWGKVVSMLGVEPWGMFKGVV